MTERVMMGVLALGLVLMPIPTAWVGWGAALVVAAYVVARVTNR